MNILNQKTFIPSKLQAGAQKVLYPKYKAGLVGRKFWVKFHTLLNVEPKTQKETLCENMHFNC